MIDIFYYVLLIRCSPVTTKVVFVFFDEINKVGFTFALPAWKTGLWKGLLEVTAAASFSYCIIAQ